ncbi:MAG: BtpA/SgcQ family protein [Deltaproteobacteria bacterium]
MNLNSQKPQLIGMVHVRALPGTPRHCHNIDAIVETAINEASQLEKAGFTAIILENMHDVPYLRGQVGPEITAGMASIAYEVRQSVKIPIGIQILAGANEEALSVAQAAELNFIRVEGFVFSHIADEGMIESCAGRLLRLRKELGAENIKIFADIKKKHSSHAITSDISISETAHAAEFFGVDGVILTGSATGSEASPQELHQVSKHVSIPVWIGSGVTPTNLIQYKEAQGWIVGSSLKEKGKWDQSLDPSALNQMSSAFQKLTR